MSRAAVAMPRCAPSEKWSHPPGLKRQPADSETGVLGLTRLLAGTYNEEVQKEAVCGQLACLSF